MIRGEICDRNMTERFRGGGGRTFIGSHSDSVHNTFTDAVLIHFSPENCCQSDFERTYYFTTRI